MRKWSTKRSKRSKFEFFFFNQMKVIIESICSTINKYLLLLAAIIYTSNRVAWNSVRVFGSSFGLY